jgi:hypothetical protein
MQASKLPTIEEVRPEDEQDPPPTETVPEDEPVPTEPVTEDEPVSPLPLGATREDLATCAQIILYDRSSILETAIATLSANTLVETNDAQDPAVIIEKFATVGKVPPELVLFVDPSPESLARIVAAGVSLVHVLVTSVDKPADTNIVYFGICELADHVPIIPGAGPLFLLEYLLCAQYPAYQSELGVTSEAGEHFISAMKVLVGRDSSPAVWMWKLVNSVDACDKMLEMVAQGRILAESRIQDAAQCVARGLTYSITHSDKKYIVTAVYGGPLAATIEKMVQERTGAPDYILLYHMEGHIIEGGVYPGWRIRLLGSATVPSSSDVLSAISPNFTIPSDDHSAASAWLPAGSAKGILPFIYP